MIEVLLCIDNVVIIVYLRSCLNKTFFLVSWLLVSKTCMLNFREVRLHFFDDARRHLPSETLKGRLVATNKQLKKVLCYKKHFSNFIVTCNLKK